jgi:hypothetical protein
MLISQSVVSSPAFNSWVGAIFSLRLYSMLQIPKVSAMSAMISWQVAIASMYFITRLLRILVKTMIMMEAKLSNVERPTITNLVFQKSASSIITINGELGKTVDRSPSISLLFDMSSFCNASAQRCSDNCCDRYGFCPSVSGYSCYYTYSTVTSVTVTAPLTIGTIIGIAVGTIVVIVLIGLTIWWRKRQAQMLVANVDGNHIADNSNLTTIIIPGQNNGIAQPISAYPGQMITPTPFGPTPIYNAQPYQATPFQPTAYNPVAYQGDPLNVYGGCQPQTVYNPYAQSTQASPSAW